MSPPLPDSASQGPIALCCANLRAGGVQRMTLHLAEGLAQAGWPVDLLLASRRGPMKPPQHSRLRILDLPQVGRLRARAAVVQADPLGLGVNLRPLILPLKGFASLRSVPGLADYLRAQTPRSLFAPAPDFIFAATLAQRLAHSQVPIVASLRSHLSAGLDAKAKTGRHSILPALARALEQVSTVHAVSHTVADDLAQVCHLDRQAIRVSHSLTLNTDIDPQDFACPDHPWLTSDRSTPVAISVGRISPQKDYETLLRALHQVRRERPLRLIIVGDDGPLNQTAAASRRIERLRQMLQDLELQDAVDFVGYQDSALPWLAQADVFVLSSCFEGLPNVVIEALACGRTIVATDAPGGTAEILDGGRYGHLTPVGDATALSRALIQAMDAPADPAQQMARAQRFDWNSALAAYERLLTGQDAQTAKVIPMANRAGHMPEEAPDAAEQRVGRLST